MPIETSLPFPNPQKNLSLGWPRPAGNLSAGGAFETNGFGADFINIGLWQGAVGAGTMDMQIRNGVLCARLDDTVQRTFIPFAIVKPLATNLGPGFQGVEWARVYRLTVQLSMDGSLGRGSGLQFAPSSTISVNFTEQGQPAFGVVGDGAGGWEYLQGDLGAFPGNITDEVLIPVATVPDAEDWNTFIFEIINSAPGRTATMTLTVNGILVVSRNWVAPLALPDFSGVSGTKFVWGPRCDTAGVDLFMGSVQVDMGRFTQAGLELLS